MDKSYEIQNLDCAHCGAKIEEAIRKLEGVEEAVLNFPLKKLRIKGEHSEELLRQMNDTARSIEPEVVIVPLSGAKTYEFIVNDLDCAHCGEKIRAVIAEMNGIESATLNFPLKKLTVVGRVDEETVTLMNELAQALEPGTTIVPAEEEKQHSHHEDEENDRNDIILLIIGIVLFAAAVITGRFTDSRLAVLPLYIASYLLLGRNVLKATVRNIKAKNFFDENTLMTVATLGAFALGEYSEAVGVMLFFKIGEMFEDRAVAKSRKAITEASELRVDEADVLRDGSFVRISSDEISAGDIIRVKAGERIAADGIVETGSALIDTSAVTGEPLPVRADIGDAVMSGCINTSETFTMKATANASDSTISRIAKAVEDASAAKPEIDRFITRFSKVYTPVVLAIAALTALLGSLITGDWSKWVYSALTFLVISCPCALVLSVPLAYFSGIGAASKLGILFKGGNAIEALAKIKAVAFDKTGTLTKGTFSVTGSVSYGDMSDLELLELCAACEQSSSHPIAQSIVAACESDLPQPEKVTETAGRGLSAMINGENILCGNRSYMEENGVSLPEEELPDGTVVYVARKGKAEGRIIVSDTVKETSGSAVASLNSMGIATAMFTGDKTSNAEKTGRELGIAEVCGDMLPNDKLAGVARLCEKYGPVMFVGDGINDGPVLAGADVGGAMQTGSDLALEAADVVFMNSEPLSVYKAKRLSDKTQRIAYENIIFALAVKAIVLLLGLIGHPNMWFAVFADSGTAMLLVLNSIRALSIKKYK
jgi:Cd2+/Zn2+-exporting ATPase